MAKAATKATKTTAKKATKPKATKATKAAAKPKATKATKAAAKPKATKATKAAATKPKATKATKAAAAKPKATKATKATATKPKATKATKATATKPKATKATRATTAKPKTTKATRATTAKPKATKRTTDIQNPASSASQLAIYGIEPYKLKKSEEYMNDTQKEHFRAILSSWKMELMEEVDRTMSHMKDEAANFPDPADRATQEEEFALELRARDRERKLIKKIDGTLENIEQDEYGWCEQCGVEIGIRRLEARPTADLCIDCKTLDEIKEKHTLG